MFKSFAVAALVLLAGSTYAQYSVSGFVRDAGTMQPLASATVSLVGENRHTLSDAFGHFQFDKVQSGDCSLKVKYLGYTDTTITIKVPVDGAIIVAMKESSTMTDAVVVTATRATTLTPTTFTSVNREKIREQNFGQDLPFLLNWTPSVVTTSDAGTGIGYTGIRIRGSDATRINVTINGIPYNDSESLGTFWVDIPDIASSAENIQIQRGIGTSTNGAGAFGATINLQTTQRNDAPYAEVVNSFGSFNTRRHTFSFGTGLLDNRWIIDGRVSRISSDGFIDRASADLQSYYFAAGFYTKKTMVKGIIFGGKERTYQSWYGVPESKLNNDPEAMLITAANEGWNDIQTENLLNADPRTFNPYIYENQVDDYRQDHHQLHFSHQVNEALTINTALHYTPGKGFYEEYVFEDDLEDYGISPVTIGDSVVSESDLIRRRWLDNHFYGFTYSLKYDRNRWNVILGGAWNRYDGDHFGEVIWAQVSPVPSGFRYYFNTGDKRDFNTYVKGNFEIGQSLHAFIDLQYRTVNHSISGVDKDQNSLNVDAEFNFFNPKAGITYSFNSNSRLYASYAVAGREPVRDDFTDFPGNTPEPEKMGNLEIGYRSTGKWYSLQANYYWMNYTNQLVLTGQVNDVGAFVRTNAGKSYRMGIELEGSVRLSGKVQWNANLTLSRNKIREYKEILEDYGTDFELYPPVLVENVYKNTDISFSPNIIAGSALTYRPARGVEITLLSKHVGKQHLDNTSNDNRIIRAYTVNDLRISYTLNPTFLKEIQVGFILNNILNEEYESNGYTWGYLAGETHYRENYYYPQAGRNFMVMLTLKL